MVNAEQRRTETFLRKQDEKLVAIVASLKSIDRSLQRIAATMEKNEAIVNAEVKEDDDGRTSS